MGNPAVSGRELDELLNDGYNAYIYIYIYIYICMYKYTHIKYINLSITTVLYQ